MSAYSGADANFTQHQQQYSSGAPDVGFWEGGDPLWVSVLVAVCVLAMIAVADAPAACAAAGSRRAWSPRRGLPPVPPHRGGGGCGAKTK